MRYQPVVFMSMDLQRLAPTPSCLRTRPSPSMQASSAQLVASWRSALSPPSSPSTTKPRRSRPCLWRPRLQSWPTCLTRTLTRDWPATPWEMASITSLRIRCSCPSSCGSRPMTMARYDTSMHMASKQLGNGMVQLQLLSMLVEGMLRL